MLNNRLHTESAARYKHNMQVKLEYLSDILLELYFTF
jgi:hypothetical protein